MKHHVIITAGGTGTRMGASVPKQFLELNGTPLLQLCINNFRQFDPEINMIVVLPMDHIDTWKQICQTKGYDMDYEIAIGGKERFHSIKHGLRFISTDGVVGIHDAVRPFTNQETIKACYEAAQVSGAAIPVITVSQTLRQVTDEGSQHVDRANFRTVQTPQCFLVGLLKEAYDRPYETHFTDDASVVESAGGQITLVDGNRENIKVTHPADLAIAQALSQRVGH